MVHLRSLFTDNDLMAEVEKHVLRSYRIKEISSIIWMVTYRCNLKCTHCYEGSSKPRKGELSTYRAMELIKELSTVGKPLLFISGGEPLLRDDIYLILKESVEKGMRVILSSNGTLIDDEAADKIAEIGVSYVTLPLYGPREFHDHFTRVPGSFNKVIEALNRLNERGVKTGIKSIATVKTAKHIKYLFDLAKDIGSSLVYICDFIPVGRGKRLKSLKLSNEEWRRLMDVIIDEILLNDEYHDIEIDIGMHPSTAIYAMLRLREMGFDTSKAAAKMLTKRQNPMGQGFISLSPEGDILLSNFLPTLKIGNIRRTKLEDVTKNPLYKLLRDSDNLKGTCGKCEYRHMCGGSRVKAYLEYGDILAEDPSCLVYR